MADINRVAFGSHDLFCCRSYFTCRHYVGICVSKLVYYFCRHWSDSKYISSLYQRTGEIVVWIALVLYFALLPVILKRIMFQKMTEASAVPLITILTAPGSLCLAGYLSVFKEGSALFVALMLVLSQAIYFCVVFYMKKCWKLAFIQVMQPSHSH